MRRIANKLHRLLHRSAGAPEEYHKWYYNSLVWRSTQWMGVLAQKSVCDMWNYQEILFSLKPSLVVEFGSSYGGSALFFATIMRQIGNPFHVLSVDVDHRFIQDTARKDPNIEFMKSSSADPSVAVHILELKKRYPGPIFAILDSDHTKAHVLAEMLLLRDLLSPGDYVIVEDSNINGHPVQPFWGEGPYEAVEEYISRHPEDYIRDEQRETKFGFTYAPHGFLVRR